MIRRIATVCLGLLLAATATEARAELVLYAQTTSLAQSGSTLLNIYVSGLSSDAFANYQVTVGISALSGSGTVIFADPSVQPFSYLNAGNYIFAGDSLYATAGVAAGQYPGAPYTTSYFTFYDSSLSGANYAPASNNPPTNSSPGTLIGSLLIDAVSTNVGNTFSVSLVPTGPDATFFENAGGSFQSFQSTLGSTSGYNGTITIVGAAVPEPTGIALGMTAIVLVGGFRTIRRRRRSA